jgi:hypothetical protein
VRDTSERGTGATHLLLLVVGCLLLVLMEVHLLMHVRLLHVELRKKLVCERGCTTRSSTRPNAAASLQVTVIWARVSESSHSPAAADGAGRSLDGEGGTAAAAGVRAQKAAAARRTAAARGKD